MPVNPPTTAPVATLREEVLRDRRFPVHKIADRLLPYLHVLLEQFRPEQVILFGSYACGQPDSHSDVDLLIVKELKQSPVREAAQILKALRPIRWSGNSIPFELLIETPANHEQRAKKEGSFYAEVARSGLRLA
jgi:predicted nucleotidyltransferase